MGIEDSSLTIAKPSMDKVMIEIWNFLGKLGRDDILKKFWEG